MAKAIQLPRVFVEYRTEQSEGGYAAKGARRSQDAPLGASAAVTGSQEGNISGANLEAFGFSEGVALAVSRPSPRSEA